MNRSKMLTWLAGILIVGSVVAGWIAIGRLAEATQRGLERIEESLSTARELAADTASAAGELQRVIGIVGEGLSSTTDALAATRQVSGGVRGLLDIASIFNRVEDLTEALTQAEASILPWSRSTWRKQRVPSRKRSRCSTRSSPRCRRFLPNSTSRLLPSRRAGRASASRCGCGGWPSSPVARPYW